MWLSPGFHVLLQIAIFPFLLSFCQVSGDKASRREELQAERSLNKTMSKLYTDGEHGRFVLLVCRAKCLRQRAQIPAWLREFNMANNHSATLKARVDNITAAGNLSANPAYDPVGFHYHSHRRPMPIADIEQALQDTTRTTVLFYVVGGRAYPMGTNKQNGTNTEKQQFLDWLDTFERPAIVRVGDGPELDEWLNSECHGPDLRRRRHSEQQMIFLVVHDPQFCPETLLANLARSLLAAPASKFIVLELQRPLAEEMELSLYARLRSLAHTCRMDILIRGNLYTELPLGVLGSHIHRIADNWEQLELSHESCPEGNSSLNLAAIMAPLGPASLEFMREERILKAIERKREYLTVGIIGGVAVMALAMSIFWGLLGMKGERHKK